MIDIRYHLASIVGIFFALGLGMLMGTQLAAEGTLVQEQARLVERIEESIERMRGENRDLSQQLDGVQARLETEQQFVDDVIGALVADALTGRAVALYVAKQPQPLASRIQHVLESAGATVRVSGSPDVTEAHFASVGDEQLIFVPGGISQETMDSDWLGQLPTGAFVAVPMAAQMAKNMNGSAVLVGDIDSPLGLLTLVEQLRTGTDEPIVSIEEMLWDRLAR